MSEVIQRCHVCGKAGSLSFEHIPPKSLGNDHSVRSYKAVDIIRKANAFDASRTHEVRYSKMRRGSGVTTLCAKCNSYFGANYVREYTGCIRELGALLLHQHPKNGSKGIHLEGVHVNTLAFFKHVISNFCATTPFGTMLDCKEFLLDKESNDFPSRYQLFMFAVPNAQSIMVSTGWITALTKHGVCTLAHVASFPVGFTMLNTEISSYSPVGLGCDITSMALLRWGECPEFSLDLPFMNLDKIIPVAATEGNSNSLNNERER